MKDADLSKELFLNYLNEIFDLQPKIFTKNIEDNKESKIYAFLYKDIPEENYITVISYGLSTVDYPSWQNARPELMLTIESTDEQWVESFLDCIYFLRNVFSFSYGQIIKFDDYLATDTNMNAFFVFAPSIIDPDIYLNIDVKQNYNIGLSALYPIYKSEIKTIENIGLKEFMHNPNYDMYNVKRTEIVY